MLKAGDTVHTIHGDDVVVLDEIGRGGQGSVYTVKYRGGVAALKWYRLHSTSQYMSDLYNRLTAMALEGSPGDAFLWPLAVTKYERNSFGYVMELADPRFLPLSDFFAGRYNAQFASMRKAVEACISIAASMRELHIRGYCYQDISGGNILIDPRTGEIRLCDNDNISAPGTNSIVFATPRYSPPELFTASVRSGASRLTDIYPNVYTDYWSLSVIIFMILCGGHPLEGKRWRVPLLTPRHERALYGEDALFIFDKDDPSNEADATLNAGVIHIWNALPHYMKDSFQVAFGQRSILDPTHRLREIDWLKVLIRFRNDIVLCPNCGNDVLLDDTLDALCDTCGHIWNINSKLHFENSCIPVTQGSIIYRYNFGACDAGEAANAVGVIVASKKFPNVLFFYNRSAASMYGVLPKMVGSVEVTIQPGDVMPLRKGAKVYAFDGMFEVK